MRSLRKIHSLLLWALFLIQPFQFSLFWFLLILFHSTFLVNFKITTQKLLFFYLQDTFEKPFLIPLKSFSNRRNRTSTNWFIIKSFFPTTGLYMPTKLESHWQFQKLCAVDLIITESERKEAPKTFDKFSKAVLKRFSGAFYWLAI